LAESNSSGSRIAQCLTFSKVKVGEDVDNFWGAVARRRNFRLPEMGGGEQRYHIRAKKDIPGEQPSDQKGLDGGFAIRRGVVGIRFQSQMEITCPNSCRKRAKLTNEAHKVEPEQLLVWVEKTKGKREDKNSYMD